MSARLLPWPAGLLVVRLRGAKHLPLVDLGGSIDPFFKFRIGGHSLVRRAVRTRRSLRHAASRKATANHPRCPPLQERESVCRKNTRNPLYEETFTLPLLDLPTDHLVVELWVRTCALILLGMSDAHAVAESDIQDPLAERRCAAPAARAGLEPDVPGPRGDGRGVRRGAAGAVVGAGRARVLRAVGAPPQGRASGVAGRWRHWRAAAQPAGLPACSSCSYLSRAGACPFAALGVAKPVSSSPLLRTHRRALRKSARVRAHEHAVGLHERIWRRPPPGARCLLPVCCCALPVK